MKKKKKEAKFLGGIVLALSFMLLFLVIFGLARTVTEIEEVVSSETPEAILASAGIDDGREIALPVAYFDQRADECVNLYEVSLKERLYSRQFEWMSCGYEHKEIEQGLVDFYLDENNFPVLIEGKLTSNRGVSNMKRWFNSVDGKSKAYAGTIKMNYSASDAKFEFESEEFYPLDEVVFSAGDLVNRDGHNHLFTMNFATPFTALLSGEERFEIAADDDTFVFVGNELAIDMGGIHEEAKGVIQINENGEVYTAVAGEELAYAGIKLQKNEGSIIRIFHADRDSSESVFKLEFTGMDLNLVNTKIAENGEAGVQVAYDPTDPSYVAPLGVSSVLKPDSKKGRIIIATIYGALVVVFAVVFVMVARRVIKRKIEK